MELTCFSILTHFATIATFSHYIYAVHFQVMSGVATEVRFLISQSYRNFGHITMSHVENLRNSERLRVNKQKIVTHGELKSLVLHRIYNISSC